MNYPDLIHKLFQVNLFTQKKLSLDNCHLLDQIFDTPHRHFQTIHVAGTNGKGSVATKIAMTLQLAGFKVGLFTSPHLYCFRERIQINGKKISEENVVKLLTLLFEKIQLKAIPATFFELTTYLAFLYFAQEKIEYAVLETGLGGRLDATNIVTPLLSIITSISLDHTEVLGKTIEAITAEKAGIIKPHIPIIIGPTVPYNLIKTYADKLDSCCIQVPEYGQTFQEDNQRIALESAKYLSTLIPIPQEAILKGVAAQPPCRFEIVSSDPFILFDVAHNPAGLQELFKAIGVHFSNKKLRVLFGLSKTKDIQACLEILKEQKCPLYPVEASNGRGEEVQQLCNLLSQLKVDPELVLRYSNLHESVEYAKKTAKVNSELLVICGSFYVMQDVKDALKII